MKIIYSVLYKNGHEDVIVMPVTKDNTEMIPDINQYIQEALREDLPGEITIGEPPKEVSTIKLSEVVRVKFHFDEDN